MIPVACQISSRDWFPHVKNSQLRLVYRQRVSADSSEVTRKFTPSFDQLVIYLQNQLRLSPELLTSHDRDQVDLYLTLLNTLYTNTLALSSPSTTSQDSFQQLWHACLNHRVRPILQLAWVVFDRYLHLSTIPVIPLTVSS